MKSVVITAAKSGVMLVLVGAMSGAAFAQVPPSPGIPQRNASLTAVRANPASRKAPTRFRRLPPLEREISANSQVAENLNRPVDGTWREDGRHLVINFNGQQMRLEKETDTPHLPAQSAISSGGDVMGRLSNGGRPVANCTVALLPLTKSGGAYDINGSAEPLISHTDQEGIYRFDNVPVGPYKLTWLPAGERQWIRRVAFRPDVRVKSGDVSHIKEIRVALRTVN